MDYRVDSISTDRMEGVNNINDIEVKCFLVQLHVSILVPRGASFRKEVTRVAFLTVPFYRTEQ